VIWANSGVDIDLLDPADERQTDELPEVEGANDIRQMLGSLSERQRAIIYMRYFRGHDEQSDRTGTRTQRRVDQ